MIEFVLVVPHPELPEDRYLTKIVSWPVLPRIGEMIYLPRCMGRDVEQVRHDFMVDDERHSIEVVVGVLLEEFLGLCEEAGWGKNGFD